jgi:hypothetical protein
MSEKSSAALIKSADAEIASATKKLAELKKWMKEKEGA